MSTKQNKLNITILAVYQGVKLCFIWKILPTYKAMPYFGLSKNIIAALKERKWFLLHNEQCMNHKRKMDITGNI